MKTFPECYTCLVRQAVSVIQQNETDPESQFRAIKRVLRYLAEADDRLSPSQLAGETNRIISQITGQTDPYREMKRTSHALAMSYFDELRELVKQGEAPLEQALKISAAGNVIDVIHVNDYHLWDEVMTTVEEELAGASLEAFRERLADASRLLILADNVGETVFDRVLIETLPVPVVYAVKSGPILNDATREDAEAAGLDQVALIAENGTCSPGTVLSQATPEFRELFTRSSLVLAKGQANYETLDDQGDKVFFLFRVKCPVISRKVKIQTGRLALVQGQPLS